jgi:hypothetical protein
MYTGLHGNPPSPYSCQILMKLEYSRRIFEKNVQISNFIKIGLVDRQTDRHDEADSCFTQCCELAYKNRNHIVPHYMRNLLKFNERSSVSHFFFFSFFLSLLYPSLASTLALSFHQNNELPKTIFSHMAMVRMNVTTRKLPLRKPNTTHQNVSYDTHTQPCTTSYR